MGVLGLGWPFVVSWGCTGTLRECVVRLHTNTPSIMTMNKPMARNATMRGEEPPEERREDRDSPSESLGSLTSVGVE